MYTLSYSPGSASMAPRGALEESGASHTLVHGERTLQQNQAA
jgi:hypothetical protein